MLDAQALRAYQMRWQLVTAITEEELQEASVAQRWRQFNALNGMMRALGLEVHRDPTEIELVRQRWNWLKDQWLLR